MRFLLDNDVDVRVRGVLVRAGHDAWTASEAGLAGVEAAVDDEVSIYAHDRGAAVVSHDNEFARRRRRNTFGQHVHLRCDQPDAPRLVERHLPDLVAALQAQPVVTASVSHDGVTAHPPSWR